MKKITTQGFIEKAEVAHGKLFDYSEAHYLGAREKLTVICKDHGRFEIVPYAHWIGQGCGKCKGSRISLSKRSNAEAFVAKANDVHGDKFDYSEVEYVNHHTKVKIGCSVHGTFLQRPNDHLHQSQGCPRCMRCGFNIAKPGSLYVLTKDNWLKIGITNRVVSVRAKEILKSSGHKFDIRATFKFDSGDEALRVETLLLNGLRQEYQNPVEIFNGSTETFVDLPLEVVLKEIASAIESKDSHSHQ